MTDKLVINTEDKSYDATLWVWELNGGAIQIDVTSRSERDEETGERKRGAIQTAELTDAEALRISDYLRMAVLRRRERLEREAAEALEAAQALREDLDREGHKLAWVVYSENGGKYASFYWKDRARAYLEAHFPGGSLVYEDGETSD